VAAAKLCRNRKKYLFWDEYHPSDAANLLIANALISTLKFFPDNSTSPAPSPSPSSS